MPIELSLVRPALAAALVALGTVAACSSNRLAPCPPMKDDPESRSTLPPEQRVEDLLRRMTLDEKLAYVGGDREFFIRPIPRLGIPEIKMSDGPAGCRNWGPNTVYPAAVALAASFDAALAERVGRGIGRDCRARGVHILLAPGVNLQRSPLNGRNFEYLGEDPFLAGKTAAAFIRGVQGEGVLATVKHFAGNNQEWDRWGISSEIDERTLREIYLPAFERAVREGHVAAVMTAYNLLNGTYCSQHEWLLNSLLKKEWGFSGFVMSDWGAVHDAEGAVKGGLDLEMPSGVYMSREHLSSLIAQKKVDPARIDDKVRRILSTITAAGFLDRPQKRDDIPLDDPQSSETSLAAARTSIVLLKNAGSLLPLDRAKVRRIAVLGPNASPAVYGGSGSAFGTPFHATSVLDGLKQSASGVEITYHPGVQQPSEPGSSATAEVSALARQADLVVVSVGYGQSAATGSSGKPFEPFWPPGWAREAGVLVEAENSDRPFALPRAQLETLRLAMAVNPRTVVVVNAGGAVDLGEFLDRIPALLWAWYPGQEGGRALAEVLWGDVNPSGKLPMTFGARYADYPSAPYYQLNVAGKTPYTEGVFVGYRGFDAHAAPPAFPFGYGLSYTAFTYGALEAKALADGSATVTFAVTNVGKRSGAEVVEVYVAPPRKATPPRPPKELKGYARVSLEPGESRQVSVTLEPRAFAYWNDQRRAWTVDPAPCEILVGASSRDIRMRQNLTLTARELAP